MTRASTWRAPGGVQSVELADECGAVIGRQRGAGEDDARAGALELLDHLPEVGLGDGEGDAAEAIVAAEFEHDDGRLFGQRHEDAGEAVLRGVAAHAERSEEHTSELSHRCISY